jgi:hypothetical protein
MFLYARSIRNHQPFKEVLSDSILRGCGNIEWMKIARREQIKASLRLSDGNPQIIEKSQLVRCRTNNALNLFVRSQRANCS